MKKYLLIYSFVFAYMMSFSQNGNGNYKPVFWKLSSLSGDLHLNTSYREIKRYAVSFYDLEKSNYYSGGISLNSNSYFWHPNFLSVNIDAEYNPEKNNDSYLVIPDHAETKTLNKLNFKALILKQKTINLSAFSDYTNSYSNRENLSNIKTSLSNYGGSFNYANKIIPFQIDYRKSNWTQKEIQNNRYFNNYQTNYQAKFSNSIFKQNKNELTIFRDEYKRIDSYIDTTKNVSDNCNLSNAFVFNDSGTKSMNSLLSYTNQTGYDKFERLQVYEIFNFSFPYSIDFMANYNFYKLDRNFQHQTLHNSKSVLKHKLFQSVFSDIFFENNIINNSDFDEKNYKYGFDIKYEKNISIGHFSVSYGMYNHRQQRTSEPVDVMIFNEECRIIDGQIVLLKNPYIDLNSIIVKDISGTIIFQLYFDYILIQRENFIEIQRIPGGQITNNSNVYVDYSMKQNGSYSYDLQNNYLNTNLSLFKNLIEIFFRKSTQDYTNLSATDFVSLNYFDQYLYGINLNFKALSCGAEYDDYKSSIIPYKLFRYYLLFQGNIKNKLLYTLSGNIHDYRLVNENVNQFYADANTKISYLINQRFQVNFECGFRKQAGKQIDLDLLTSKSEIILKFRKTFIKLDYELYNRKYLNEKINYNGFSLQLIRKF